MYTYTFMHLCIVNSAPIITYSEVRKWQCTLGWPLPRERKALWVFASIILFLTQRPYSAVVVRFTNSRRMRGAGRKKKISLCLFQRQPWAFKRPSFMLVTYECFCVDSISGREMLPQHNAAVTRNIDGECAPVHFPWSRYLHRWLYSTLVCFSA